LRADTFEARAGAGSSASSSSAQVRRLLPGCPPFTLFLTLLVPAAAAPGRGRFRLGPVAAPDWSVSLKVLGGAAASYGLARSPYLA
jgi:hypothetical protein